MKFVGCSWDSSAEEETAKGNLPTEVYYVQGSVSAAASLVVQLLPWQQQLSHEPIRKWVSCHVACRALTVCVIHCTLPMMFAGAGGSLGDLVRKQMVNPFKKLYRWGCTAFYCC